MRRQRGTTCSTAAGSYTRFHTSSSTSALLCTGHGHPHLLQRRHFVQVVVAVLLDAATVHHIYCSRHASDRSERAREWRSTTALYGARRWRGTSSSVRTTIINSDGCFCNVGRDDNLAHTWWWRLKDSALVGCAQCRVQRVHTEAACVTKLGAVREQLLIQGSNLCGRGTRV